MRRHSWKKPRRSKYVIKNFDGNLIEVRKCRECKNCGLMKGTVSTSYWQNTLTYFKDDKILSEHRIPYTCTGEIKKEVFLTKEDFYV